MQGRIRHYRVHLIAYDALLLHHWHLPSRIPSPSPTPLAPLVPLEPLSPFTRSLLQPRQRRLLRKTRLICEGCKIADV